MTWIFWVRIQNGKNGEMSSTCTKRSLGRSWGDPFEQAEAVNVGSARAHFSVTLRKGNDPAMSQDAKVT